MCDWSLKKNGPRNKRGERTSKAGNRCSSLTEKSQNFDQRQAPQQSIQRSYAPLTISTGPDVTGLVAATTKIPTIMWAVTLLGGAFTVGFSFLFGVPKFLLHLFMTGLLSASLALVIVLIVAFDCPFRGELS